MYSTIFFSQQSFFQSGATLPVSFRLEQLKKLRAAVVAHDAQIVNALHKDLRKSEFESFGSEIGQVLKDIDFTIRHLASWAKPRRVSTPLMFFPSSSKIHRDPLGNVLIIAPWNYPFLLAVSPLISSIAGGNTAILKPSEEAPATAAVIEQLISSIYPSSYVAVVQGIGGEVIPEMMSSFRFDHVFFTGSTLVGQKIMELAATKLVPVTLELGGKSPCIVDASANIAYAAKKIVWSKIMNAGQTCVAPDYLMVHQSVKDALIREIVDQLRKMLGDDPQKSEDFGRIINRKRFSRLVSYLAEGKVVSGGIADEEDLYIAPTLLEDVQDDALVMQEEIFGPVLPVFTYQSKEEVVERIQRNPFPLSLYLYAEDREVQDFFMKQLRFGGGCINNGIIHLGNPHLPFGGVGPSGTGQYHGRFGFDTFTRPKAVLHSPSWFDVPVWYAPFKGKAALLRKIFKVG
jgi:aldehyde dehydrogenase (NAD+)